LIWFSQNHNTITPWLLHINVYIRRPTSLCGGVFRLFQKNIPFL
jgi:hypothetical protein